MKLRQRLVVITLVVTLSPVGMTSKANASLLPTGDITSIFDIRDTLESILGPIQAVIAQQLQTFEEFFNQSITTVFGEDLGGVFSDTLGALGLPDPREMEKTIEEIVGSAQDWTDGVTPPIFPNFLSGFSDSPSSSNQSGTPTYRVPAVLTTPSTSASSSSPATLDHFNSNPIALKNSLTNEAERTLAKGIGATVLSQEGQAAMKQDMEAANQTLTAIGQKNQEAQQMDVTQDVMKNLTAIITQQSQLQTGSYIQLMSLRQQEAATNQLLANISEALDETNRRAHSEAMSNAVRVMHQASGIYLPGSERRKAASIAPPTR